MGCVSQDTKIHFNVGRECTAADESGIGGIINVGLFCIRGLSSTEEETQSSYVSSLRKWFLSTQVQRCNNDNK